MTDDMPNEARKEVVLVVDDDPQITSFLKRYLEKQAYRVFCASDGITMDKVLTREKIDLCILDISLPGRSGFDITRDLRATSDLPILVLSGRSDAIDRVVGLEFGADDYMAKPFEPRELLARIRTILRRCRIEKTAADAANAPAGLYQFENWVVDATKHMLTDTTTDAAAPLTTTEFQILLTFVKAPHNVLSRTRLMDAARGRETFSGERTIDVHIAHIRKRIEPDPQNPRFIKTIHGVGYCFIANVTRLDTLCET